jgi:uncharacterized membrane protein YsdA (DUF1294 family)
MKRPEQSTFVTKAGRRRPKRSATIAAVIVWGALFVALLVTVDWSLYLDWLIAGTVTTFLFYTIDKAQARRNGWRVPEVVLQGMVLAGGVIGGWLGMLVLRHKTLHRSFWVVQWIATVLYLVLAWLLVR